jgi:hypothetical protein
MYLSTDLNLCALGELNGANGANGAPPHLLIVAVGSWILSTMLDERFEMDHHNSSNGFLPSLDVYGYYSRDHGQSNLRLGVSSQSGSFGSTSNLVDKWVCLSPCPEKIVSVCKNCTFSFRVAAGSRPSSGDFCSKGELPLILIVTLYERLNKLFLYFGM